MSLETFHDFYNFVSANYNVDVVDSKEEKYHIPDKGTEGLNSSDMIIYEVEEKDIAEQDMIKVEVMQDTDYAEEWIEEEFKLPDPPKRVEKRKVISSIFTSTQAKTPVRQATALDSADDQRIRETANMNCHICDELLDSLRDAKAHFKMAHAVEGYLICCERQACITLASIVRLIIFV